MAISPKNYGEFYVNLNDELNFWGARVTKRILGNFDRLDINKTAGGKGKHYTGELYRNIWWTVHNAAGGNTAMITFYFMHYARYLEIGVGKGNKKTTIPPMTTMEPIARADSNRKAKPFLTSEIRLHLRWLSERLFSQYLYAGSFYVIRGLADGLGDQDITRKWVEENREELTEGVVNYITGR